MPEDDHVSEVEKYVPEDEESGQEYTDEYEIETFEGKDRSIWQKSRMFVTLIYMVRKTKHVKQKLKMTYGVYF